MNAVAPDERVQHGADLEARQEPRGRAGQQRAVQRDEQSVHVIDRQRVNEHVVRREAPYVDERRRVRRKVAMADHRALRTAGRARRVQDRGDVVVARATTTRRNSRARCDLRLELRKRRDRSR